ncbi:MAG: hypothetical protein AAFO91_16185, partial [Bacteroidota bacterium]
GKRGGANVTARGKQPRRRPQGVVIEGRYFPHRITRQIEYAAPALDNQLRGTKGSLTLCALSSVTTGRRSSVHPFFAVGR